MTKTQVEVITPVERRRRWSRAEKGRIVASAMEPGAVAYTVGREAGIHASQLYRWRQELCGPARAAAGSAAVTIAAEPGTPFHVLPRGFATHSRRKFFVLADVTAKARGKLAVIAAPRLRSSEAHRCDLRHRARDQRLFHRRAPRGEPRARRATRADLETWMRKERAKLSRHSAARMNDVDPQAWLADVLARINDQLLPWNWKIGSAKLAA
jgi:Transposase/IS66 C-terminal element